MKKFKFPLNRLILLAMITIIIGVIAVFCLLTSNYYYRSKTASQKIGKYLQEVALEKVDKEKADQVIDFLKPKEKEEININEVNNPFKVFEPEPLEKQETSETTNP